MPRPPFAGLSSGLRLMHSLDRSLSECRALVVDPNPTSRSILAAQLRDLGLGHTTQSSRLSDARRHLESRAYEFVLCERSFPNEEETGQDLLDELRRAQLLPFSTVFVMITAEASYQEVAEAAESALDGYLLKPHTAAALAERLRHARQRKRVLRDIFEAIEAGDFDAAARSCLQRFRDRSAYWLYAARIGAELLLRLQRPDAARTLYEAVTAAKALPWAKLGIARAQLAARQWTPARRTLDALLEQDGDQADAYDVMGRLQVEQGQLDEALATYRRASELTPASLTRLQKRGMLAHYLGQHDEATRALERAAATGMNSKLFDLQSLVLLAFSRWRQRDGKGLQRCLDQLVHAGQKSADPPRARRLAAVVHTLVSMQQRRVADVIEEIRVLAGQITDPAFDVEAACNLLSLLAELSSSELKLEDVPAWVDQVALRFAGSKALSDLLACCLSSDPPLQDRLRERHAELLRMAEESITHTLAGDPRSAVRQLLDHARRTCNARLIDNAALTLQRHRERITDADALAQQVDELRRRYGGDQNTTPFVQDGIRGGGAVALRAAASSGGGLSSA